MQQENGLNRRAFLKNAGMTAVLGAVGTRTAFAEEIGFVESAASGRQVYDFDEVYHRVDTDSIKWDSAIATYGDEIEVGMGIADMDFQAPQCITKALAERCEHENWGYLRRPSSYVQALVDWKAVADTIERGSARHHHRDREPSRLKKLNLGGTLRKSHQSKS